METPQEWRRRAGRRHHDDGTEAMNRTSAHHATTLASGAQSGAINGGSHARTTAHTVASASKSVPKESGAGTGGAMTKHSVASIPPSRWKELRQSVRIKATMETEERRVKNAKIADLCDEDRDKVAKLIRRIVEIGTLQEESEVEFNRQRSVLEAEITELREQVKHDTGEIEELSEKLKATLLKLRDYQERVLVLEESTEAEARYRMETDQTMDLLKLEVEKLRKLVRRQKDEMELKDQDEQRKFKQELERVNQQLKDAQDELLQERRERILEKQKELDERLQKSMANSAAIAASDNAYHSISTSSQIVTREMPSSLSIPEAASMLPPQLDMSSFLNTSMELPEKIKDIMDEWKQRMEVAMAETARNISEQKSVPLAESPTIEKTSSCEKETSYPKEVEETMNKKDEQHEDLSELRRSDPEPAGTSPRTTHQKNQLKPSRAHLKKGSKVQQMQFDKFLRIESDSELDAVDSGGDDDLVGQDDSEEEKHADESDEEQVDDLPTRRTKKRDELSTSQRHHHHHDAFRFRRKSTHDQQRQRNNYFQSQSETLTQKVDRMPTREGNIFGDGDSEASFADEINGNSSSFVLMNGFDDHVQRGNSFSILYDTSLFDVVDALENGRDTAPTSASMSTNVPNQRQNGLRTSSPRSQHHHHQPDDSRGPLTAISAETSSSRFRDLLQGMQARERKLALLNGQAGLLHQTASSSRHHHQHQDSGNPRNGLDADDDFDLFNDVKDVYEQDVLQARQRAAPHRPATSRAYLSSATRVDHSNFDGSDNEFLGPPLAAHDLSLREAIEKDMAELLAEEAFQDLLH